jgi:tryptophan-rich hypothetical protein
MKKQANLGINRINPAKLLLSKWTAVVPMNKEKHFLVTRVDKDEQDIIISCSLEAVMTRNEYSINWQELKDKSRWLAGWL